MSKQGNKTWFNWFVDSIGVSDEYRQQLSKDADDFQESIATLLFNGVEIYFPSEFLFMMRQSTVWYNDIYDLTLRYKFPRFKKEFQNSLNILFKSFCIGYAPEFNDGVLIKLYRFVKKNGKELKSNELWDVIYDIIQEPILCLLITKFRSIEMSQISVERAHKMVHRIRNKYDVCLYILYIFNIILILTVFI